MKNWIKPSVSLCVIVLGLAACGERAPAAWNANLDIACKPHDPYDKMFAMVAPKKFWREQEYDLGTMLKAGLKNIEMSTTVLQDSTSQKGEYLSRAQQAAREKGLSGKDARANVKKNMDRYNAEVKDIQDRLKAQEKANEWVRKCQKAVVQELRKLGLKPVEFDSEKHPRHS